MRNLMVAFLLSAKDTARHLPQPSAQAPGIWTPASRAHNGRLTPLPSDQAAMHSLQTGAAGMEQLINGIAAWLSIPFALPLGSEETSQR